MGVASRRLTYTRAGHDRPVLLREGAVESLGGEGAFLGCLEADQLDLSEEQTDLLPGDRLVLYTDGLADAVDANHQLFGLARFVSPLQSLTGLSAAELCAATFDHIAARYTIYPASGPPRIEPPAQTIVRRAARLETRPMVQFVCKPVSTENPRLGAAPLLLHFRHKRLIHESVGGHHAYGVSQPFASYLNTTGK